MLIIEVDGFTHNDKALEDSDRDHKLRALGYHILRIDDEYIFNDLENVTREIEYIVELIEMKLKKNNNRKSPP